MPDREPVSAENCTSQYEDHQLVPADADAVIPWGEARDRLASSQLHWFATVRPGGRPHVRPVLAVWVDGALYSTTNPGAARDATSVPALRRDSDDRFGVGTDERFAPRSTRWRFQ
jgi:hypothetical protein